MMLRSVVLAATATLTALALPGPAAADPIDTLVASPAREVSDRAADRDAPCSEQPCPSSRVTRAPLGGGARLELRTVGADAGATLRLLLVDGDHTYAWDDPQPLAAQDCGMGKCVDDTILGDTLVRQGDVVWIQLRVLRQLSHGDPALRAADRAWRFDVTIGCQVPHDAGEAPRCVAHHADTDRTSRTTLHGRTLATAIGHEPATETLVAF
jgi:hypothetical protein